MLASSNSPIVHLATRKWLDRLVAEGYLLDDPSRRLMERAIAKCLKVSPGGLVHDVARDLGARADLALLAGSISELFYAVCSLTDDLQDGDADQYLGPVPPALALNVQSHLLCLLAVRADEMVQALGTVESRGLVAEIYRTGAAMLHGQRMEIVRDPWTVEIYEKVAGLSAGEQFGMHLSLGALAAGVDQEPWRRLGRAYGALLQLVADGESRDPRLEALAAEEVTALRDRLTRELERDSLGLGDRARDHAQRLMERCQRVV